MNRQTPDGEFEQCPCCDYFTLAARGAYLICPLCFWEDEGHDLAQLDLESGANRGLTLRQARAAFAEIGACDAAMLKHVAAPGARAGYARRLRRA